MKANSMICLAAGLLGGLISHYAMTQPVLAQVLTNAPTEVRAQQFVVVDSKGQVQATIKADDIRGNNIVEIVNKDGQVVWSAGGSMVRSLTASR